MEVTIAHVVEVVVSALVFIYAWRVCQDCFKPYFDALLKRELSTTGAESAAKEAADKKASLLNEYDQRLQQERLKGLTLRDEIVASCRAEATKFTDDAHRIAASSLEMGRLEIKKAAEEALEQIEQQSEIVAQQITDKVLSIDENRVIH